MGLTDDERKWVVQFRLEKANSAFSEIAILTNNALWHTAANRLYYACYYAATALLIKNEYFSKSHEGTIGLFGQHFIKTNIIDPKHGATLSQTESLRKKGDYNDMFVIDPENVKQLVVPTEEFIVTIEKLTFA